MTLFLVVAPLLASQYWGSLAKTPNHQIFYFCGMFYLLGENLCLTPLSRGNKELGKWPEGQGMDVKGGNLSVLVGGTGYHNRDQF